MIKVKKANKTSERKEKPREEKWPDDFPEDERKIVIRPKQTVENEEEWPDDYSISEKKNVITLVETKRGEFSLNLEKKHESHEEKWPDDFSEGERKIIIRFIKEFTKLVFAKHILLFLFVLFLILLAITYCFPDSPHSERIWYFTSGAINSIVSFLIGYYFTTKRQ